MHTIRCFHRAFQKIFPFVFPPPQSLTPFTPPSSVLLSLSLLGFLFGWVIEFARDSLFEEPRTHVLAL